jgi:hypothetical protein
VLAGMTGLTQSDISNIASAVWAAKYTANSLPSSFGSLVSDLYSRLVLTQSTASDAASAAQQGSSRTLLVQSRLSDFDSRTVSDFSDVRSAIAAIVTALSPSDLSDIASAVWAFGTRKVTSNIDLNASTMSDLRSAIAAAAVTLDASTMSDIASQVWAHPVGVRVDSRLLVQQSRLSDVYSLLSDTQSDMHSYLVGLSGMLSDTYSLVGQLQTSVGALQTQEAAIYSLLTEVQGEATTTYALLSSLESDFTSRFPAAIPELTTDPGATPSWAQQAALQWMWLKNSSKSTSSKRFLRNAAGATVLSATISDDGTSYVQGKLG